MITISDKHNCCGCSACVRACPKQCISMQQDAEGFLYPQVDSSSCIDCGLCEKVCPFLHPYESRTPMHTYAAINNDEQVRMESSSGGIFTLLAEQVINDGGVVFGARFDKNWQVTLDHTEAIDGLAAFRGSKYVQACVGDTYAKCAKFLKTGRKVMYSGTPCQIAGLKHYLRKEYDNLLTVDFVCHGVPSPKVWEKYLHELVETVNVQGVSMRDKQHEGWKRFNFVLDYKKEGKMISLSSWHQKNDYMNAFLRDMILRPSCYACKAKECRSHSDITIADFWGIQSIRPAMDDDKGTGLVLIHTTKGKEYVPFDKMQYDEVTFEEGYRNNPAIFRSAIPWPRRAEFFQQLDNEDGVVELIRKSLRPTVQMRLKSFIRKIAYLPVRIVRKTIRIIGGGKIQIRQRYIPLNTINIDTNNISVTQNYIINSINFRDKQNGWSKYCLTIELH